MEDKVTVTINVDKQISLSISDILCWLDGYLMARNDMDDYKSDFLWDAYGKLQSLNRELKDKTR